MSAHSKLPETSSPVEETEITISDNPLVKLSVTSSVSLNPEFVALLKKAASLTASATKKELEIREWELLQRGYRAGAKVALILYNEQPQCDPIIQRTLKRMAGVESPIPSPTIWTKPTFMTAYKYIKDLGVHGRVKILGYLGDGTEVLIGLVGHLDTQWTEEDKVFYGICEIGYGDTGPGNHGFVLGSIGDTGTALIINEKDELLAYSPEHASDCP